MSWEDILKNDLKNQIDTWAKTQSPDLGPIVIVETIYQETGPKKGMSNTYLIKNPQQFEEIKRLYSQTHTVKDRGHGIIIEGLASGPNYYKN
tara:strand:+ start:81 stop:356 length:276 start_codon:yes stop_codon:yes gene_type:complete